MYENSRIISIKKSTRLNYRIFMVTLNLAERIIDAEIRGKSRLHCRSSASSDESGNPL